MKRLVSLALALSMMFMCAGNVFAADYGAPIFQDSNGEITITFELELEPGDGITGTITVPAAMSVRDSESGEDWFYASGKAVKTGFDRLVANADKAYGKATWYFEETFQTPFSFNETDRYFNDMTLYGRVEKTPAPGADVEVSEGAKNEGIVPEEITNTFPAGNKLKLDVAAEPATTAQTVVNQIATDNATIKAVDGSQPLYLDIKLVDAQGNPIQPGQSATITVPVPSKLHTALSGDANAVLVIHYNDDGSMKDHMLATLTDDGKMTFSTASFSTFGFIAVEKTSFDVTIENVKGGILDVTDANGIMLPVGQKVTVPSKATRDGHTFENRLYVTYVSMMDAEESDLLVNGVSVGIDTNSWNEVELSTDVVLTGVFASAGAYENIERYAAVVEPKLHSGNVFSGTLNFRHYKDGQKTDISNATFALEETSMPNDNELFEINGSTLTSKAALTEPSYTVQLKVTADGKVYTHNQQATPRVSCRVSINSDSHFNVSFVRYLADQFDAWDGGWIGNANKVPKDTAFAPLAQDQRNFSDITLKDGKPQMYGYEFDRWQQYKASDDFDSLIPVNVTTVTNELYAMAMFKGYRVNVQSLGSTGGDGGGSSGGSGGGGGGGGSTSLFGNKTTTTGIAQALTTAQAKAATSKAITAAKANGATEAVIRLKNATSISPKALQEIKAALKKAGMTGRIYSDIIANGKIASRMYIDPSKIATTGNLDLGVTIGDKATEEKFAKQYSNPIQVLKLAQKGGFGTTVTVAVKLDLSKLNTKNLLFYSFDPATGKYAPIEKVEWAINKDGYLFFNVATGGTVIIADRPFTAK